jgi:hypothetical protein
MRYRSGWGKNRTQKLDRWKIGRRERLQKARTFGMRVCKTLANTEGYAHKIR